MSDYDVVVVGGRVAGASTALLLARSGVRVALVDRGTLRQRHPLDPWPDARRCAAADPVGPAPEPGRRGNSGDPAHGVPLRRRRDGRGGAASHRGGRGALCAAAAAPGPHPGRRGRRRGRGGTARDDRHVAAVRGGPRGRRPCPGRTGAGTDDQGGLHRGRGRRPLDHRGSDRCAGGVAGALRRRGPLPLLRRAADHRLRVGLRRWRRRGPDPHQRRAHLRLRGHRTAADA